MNRGIIVLSAVILVFGAQSLFAQYELPEPVFAEPAFLTEAENVPAFEPKTVSETVSGNSGLWLSDFSEVVYFLWDSDPASLSEPAVFLPVAALAAAASSDADQQTIPKNIRNNRYYIESERLKGLADQSFEEGDYDSSTNYATESVRYAQLSDDYVVLQLKIKETNDSIASAKARLDWAAANGGTGKYLTEYTEAQNYYDASLSAQAEENWDAAITAAHQVIEVLAYIQGPDGRSPLPAKYTVRSWASTKDCLWNIAGRSWAYGDSNKWRLIYDANKAQLPEPENPDLIHPGMVLDIPSIKGETRLGTWDSSRTYSPLR